MLCAANVRDGEQFNVNPLSGPFMTHRVDTCDAGAHTSDALNGLNGAAYTALSTFVAVDGSGNIQFNSEFDPLKRYPWVAPRLGIDSQPLDIFNFNTNDRWDVASEDASTRPQLPSICMRCE